jgi:hypothetical protein
MNEDSSPYTNNVKNTTSAMVNTSEFLLVKTPESSEWQCYLFGNRPGGMGIVYIPPKGRVPNWFVRLAMRIFFDCLWVKNKSEKKT